MSRQSYHRGECVVCGGDTAGNGFARASHERGKQHVAALRASGNRALAATLQREADAIQARKRKYRKLDAENAARRAREA